MKKIIAICLALIIAASTTITVFAAAGCFWYSPSGRPAPIVVDFDPHNDECTGKLVITPYGDRHELSDFHRALLEKAYDSIANAKNIAELNADFAAFIAQRGFDSNALAVSDLFDIHIVGCDNHDEHVGFDIILSSDVLHSFVGLLHMNKDGVWEYVPDGHIENNKTHLVFSVDSFSPFAIVVDTTGMPPQTGDNVIIVSTVVMLASIVALACVMHKRKKQIAQ